MLRRPADRPRPDRLSQTAQLLLAGVLQARVGSGSGEQTHGLGDEDGSRRRGAAETLRVDHRRSGILVASPRDVPGPDAYAQLERHRRAAGLPGDRPLQLHGAGKGGPGRRERRDQAISHRLDPGRAVRPEHVARSAVELAAHPVGVIVPEHGAYGPEVREFGAENRRHRAAPPCLRRRLACRGLEQRGVTGEDRLLQMLELRSGIKPQLGAQCPDGVAVGIQRLALSSRAIQGEHELSAHALAQGLGGYELLELGHQLGAAAQREVGLDPIFDGGSAQVLQARDLGRREWLERDVGQRRATPLLERGPQPRGGTLGSAGCKRPPAVLAQAFEPCQVELVTLDAQAVSGVAGYEPCGFAAERAAQPRDHRLDGLDRSVGRSLAP